jgi:hypothetical protein
MALAQPVAAQKPTTCYLSFSAEVNQQTTETLLSSFRKAAGGA